MSRASSVGAKGKPPPPKPKPSRLSGVPAAETVTALYDYEAQAEGDLSFSTGDVIEIVSRTQNENEWWQGRVHGRQGQFPGTLYLCPLSKHTGDHINSDTALRELCPHQHLIVCHHR